jgi:hypothetical protein
VQGSVRARSSGGLIDIDRPGGDVEASTSGAGIRVTDARGRVDARTSGGALSVAFGPGNARGGALSTSGSGAVVSVDPRVPLSIDASSSGGAVQAEIPITIQGTLSARRLRGTMNGGGETLTVRSSGGGVRITSAK